MAQFSNSIVQSVSSVGTLATMIWNPSSQSATTFGPLGSVPSTAVFSGLIIANTGSSEMYLTSGSVNASLTNGIPVPAASEVYLSGYAGTGGAAGTIWASTGVSGNTTSSQVGLPSVVSVI